ncbi:DUF2264 domain-containing protein [Kitasatospora atroaurantiaca]|uniref:Uncharacterized protein DUF2264 n=1 Tax=Kitasatospora atroaurantiaca TaxID=285545 RepID=A0A561EHZ9_9ACTN|nr:DUF2264 domain-containing protein [Kitasatospora atroaurantiaca]TWE15245.1 uncharacterized protein DUF2264 [Kitasatospora atroaurantiaca]
MPSIQLPPEDRRLSPHTGWTRPHWEAVADGLLAAVQKFAGPGHALINLPGPRPSISGTRSDGLEGFARTFLLAAFRVAGAGGDDPHGLLPWYAEGLAAGTRTPTAERDLTGRDPVSWLAIGDRNQAMVEAASIALALRLTRPWLWDRLDEQVRERTRAWLADALHHTPVDNNWWLFPFTVGAFLAETGSLAEVGLDHDGPARAAVERGLAKIEQWYLGDGWYTDGRPRAFDHYNGWAFHLYPVLHAHLAGDRELLDTYGGRLAAHLDGYARTFGADGAPMHQGRSLTYRFAAATPLWAGALTGHTPLAPGATRRLASGTLRYFLDRGSLQPDGLLSLGWFGPHPPVIQSYSGPASPYWASKGFLGLLLPPDHPVWTEPEEAAPVERGDAVLPLTRPGWLIQSTAADGLVRLHNHGSDDQPADEVLPDDPLYARLGYSTVTGPRHDGPPDNHFGLVVGGELSERGRIRPLGAGDGWAASAHHPRIGGTELPGVTVTSLVLASGADEIHAHLVTGAAPGTEVRHSGWAVAGDAVETWTDGPRAGAAADPEGARLTSVLQRVEGYTAAEASRLLAGTAFGPAGALPALTGRTGSGPSLFVSVARLSRSATRSFDGLQVRTDGALIRVVWPDGSEHEALLDPDAPTIRRKD